MSRALPRYWKRLSRTARMAIGIATLAVSAIVVTVLVQQVPQTPEDWVLVVLAATVGSAAFVEVVTAIWERYVAASHEVLKPAKKGELLVVIACFQGPEEIDPQDYITGRLEEELPKHPTLLGRVRVACYPKVMEGENRAAETERARELAEELGAALVIWGVHDRYHIRAHYVVGRAFAKVETMVPLGEHRALPSQLDEFVLYVQVGLPQAITYLVLLTIGQMYYFAYQFAEAGGLFSAALECLPEEKVYAQSGATLRFYRAYAYAEIGKHDEAIVDLTEVIRLKPDDAGAYHNRGNAYRDKGEYEQAISDLTEAIWLEPYYAGAYNNRGLAYVDMGQYDEAIADYKGAIRLKPDLKEAYHNRGNAYTDMGRYDEAIADFTKAIRLKPDYAEAYSDRGTSYSKMGENDKAIADHTEAIRLKPDDAQAYNNRGATYGDMGKHDEAIADFTEAIRLKPDYAEAYNNRGLAYRRKGNCEQAIADCTEAIGLKPDFKGAYNNRGLAYTGMGRYDEAIADFTEAIRLKPDYEEVCNNLSHALSKLGQRKAGTEREGLLRQGLEAARRAEAVQEGQGAYNVACCHCLLGEKAEALVWLESALERDTKLTREDILQDTDFAEIQESEEFRQLVDKYRPE
jgi:tetratricopeptide (TPR) repeat protein